MSKIDKQIKECRNHMNPYMKNEESTKELREMCKCCEVYCGKEHDYDECRNKPCFRFWLAYEYLGWMNAFS